MERPQDRMAQHIQVLPGTRSYILASFGKSCKMAAIRVCSYRWLET